MEERIQNLITQLYERYYRPSNPIFDGEWWCQLAPKKQAETEAVIRQLLEDGREVRTGYAATSVRGYHDHYIFYKGKELVKRNWHWLTTSPNPRSRATGYDAGQRGWRLHLVDVDGRKNSKGVDNAPALCGLRPAHGWGVDLFIDRPCARCLAKMEKLGINIPLEG